MSDSDVAVDALFVDPKGPYPRLLGPEHCWDEKRDARTYAGRGPVVAHPPCQLWTNMSAVNFKRYPKEENRPGNDGGLFSFALGQLRRCGGVLEHPAGSKAWDRYELLKPKRGAGWQSYEGCGGAMIWVCQVSQCAYGHRARKRTWLLYYSPEGVPPFELDWSEPPYTHQIGHDSKMKRPRPSLRKREASATPERFAAVLIELARHAAG